MLHNDNKPGKTINLNNGVQISVRAGLKMPTVEQGVTKDLMRFLRLENHPDVLSWEFIKINPPPAKLQEYTNKVFDWMEKNGMYEQQATPVSTPSSSASPKQEVISHSQDEEKEARRKKAKEAADARARKVAQQRELAAQLSSGGSSGQVKASLGQASKNEEKASQSASTLVTAHTSVDHFVQDSTIDNYNRVTVKNNSPDNPLAELLKPKIFIDAHGQTSVNSGIGNMNFSQPGAEQRFEEEMAVLRDALNSADNQLASSSSRNSNR